MIERAANCLKRGVFPASRIAGGIGVTVLVLMVLLTVAEVFSRRVLNTPISGALELTSLGLVLFVFLTLAYCAVKGGHIALDILVTRFPKRVQASVYALMHILTAGIMGVASWQLWVQAMRVQRMGQTSGLLEIDIYPFLYLAALGCLLITLVYLVYFLNSLDEVWK